VQIAQHSPEMHAAPSVPPPPPTWQHSLVVVHEPSTATQPAGSLPEPPLELELLELAELELLELAELEPEPEPLLDPLLDPEPEPVPLVPPREMLVPPLLMLEEHARVRAKKTVHGYAPGPDGVATCEALRPRSRLLRNGTGGNLLQKGPQGTVGKERPTQGSLPLVTRSGLTFIEPWFPGEHDSAAFRHARSIATCTRIARQRAAN
jgi:hypothetical protein